MIKFDDNKNYAYPFFIAIFLHVFFLLLFKFTLDDELFVKMHPNNLSITKDSIKLDDIKIINKEDVQKMKRVGIKNGVKDLDRPDMGEKKPNTIKLPTPKSQKPNQKISFDQLGAGDLKIADKKMPPTPASPQVPATKALSEFGTQLSKNYINTAPNTQTESHFYYTPTRNKTIPRSREQDVIKQEASRNITVPVNPITNKISNFEIRYDRPEGVSEDELNSDEQAYYSFYVRSYQNYFSKIFSNYDKIIIQKPGLARAFDSKHLLIGKIDYDENGEIITVKIIKSSENDDLSYFFEETLKQLNQPNPPKVFTKNKKQFSIYYQIQIN